MTHNIEFKGFDPGADSALESQCRKVVEDHLARIERKTKSFAPDEIFARVVIDRNATRTLYCVSITLELPGKTLAANEVRHDPKATIRDAFREIERQLEHHKATLRSERLWKRFSKRQEIRARKAAVGEGELATPEEFFLLVGPHLGPLQAYLHHLLDHARAMGDLVPDDPSDEDAVDSVLLRAYQEFIRNPAPGDLRRFLKRLATQYVRSEIARRKRDLIPHLEDDVPETPPQEEVTTLGEEILYFYQPDEDRKLEDIVRDESAPTPEQEAEVSELRECVRSAMAEMPREWCVDLMMRHEDGMTRAEIARATARTEAEVAEILDRAQQLLRRRVIESRCVGGANATTVPAS